MNRVRLVSILGACALTLSVMGQGALAEDAAPKKGSSDEPAVKDIGKKDRGIFFKSPGADMPFEIQKKGQPGDKTTTAPQKGGEPRGVFLDKAHDATVKKGGDNTASTAAPAHVPFKVKLKTPAVKPVNKTATTASTTAPAKTSTSKSAPAKTAAHKAPAKATEKTATVTPASSKGSATASSGATAVQGAVLKAWLNKTGKAPHYKDGDKMEINVSASQDCSLVIYDFDGKGTLTQIFPNDYQKEGGVHAGDTVTIGGDASTFDFQVSLADGSASQQERLFIFAYPNNSKDEAPVSVAMAKIPSSPFRSANFTPADYRKLVNQSKVFFNPRSVVVKAKPRSLQVGSNPDIQTVSNELNDGNNAPNKMELSFVVEK